MNTKLTASQTLKILKNELPICFKKGVEKLPLVLDIHKDILDYYANDARFDKELLKQAVDFYTEGTNYLKKIKEGVNRIDIKGHPKTVVTSLDERHARQLLKNRQSD